MDKVASRIRLQVGYVFRLQITKWSPNCAMTQNVPPKGVSFSDLICIFAMSYQSFACLFLITTKLLKISDMYNFLLIVINLN